MLGFGAVGATMLASCTPLADVPPPVGARRLVSPPPAEARYLAVVVVDGCRADYLSATHLPTLSSMMRAGTYFPNAWAGIMESITPACHASIATGRFAKNNGGILGFWWENPTTHQYGECANLTNNLSTKEPGGQFAIDADSMSQILKQAGTPTMAGLLKEVDPTAKIYAGAGVKFYAADAAGGPDADYVSYFWNDGPNTYRPVSLPNHALPSGLLDDPALTTQTYTSMNYTHPGEQDSLVMDLAVKVIQRERPRIVILNLGEIDYPFGHQNGGPLNVEYVRDIMSNADRAMARLMDAYRELGIFEETVFAFLGDHGMVPLHQQVDVGTDIHHGGLESSSPVQVAAANAGTSIVGADFHTGGFVWIADPAQAFKMATFLDDAKMPGVSAVYFRGESGGRPQFMPSSATASFVNPETQRAYGYLLETLNGPNAPHVVLIYPEQTGSLGAGGLYGGKPNQWLGDHGGASWGSHAIPLIISGAGVRAGYTSRFPARLVDLAPTFLRLMGVPFPPLDGVILADALRKPLSTEMAGQRVMSAQLTPVVSALKRQHAVDLVALANPVNPPNGAQPQAVHGITY